MAENKKPSTRQQKKQGIRYTTVNKDKVSIYKNCIVQDGHYTLYFLVNLFNYGLYTEKSIGNQLDILSNLILNIDNSFSGVKFSLFRFQDIVPPEKYLHDFVSTVRLWNKDFQPSVEFRQNVQYLSKDYCFLAINIDEKKSVDFNQTSLLDLAKEYKDQFLDLFAKYEQQKVNIDKINNISTQLENIGQMLMKPCPEDILLSYYINRIFPSYSLILDENDFDTNKALLSFLQQDFIDHFNYFEMTNAGVEVFGADQQITYGSIIDILEFPEEIVSESFPLTHNGIVINNKTLSKQQAKLKFSRKRADINYEEETAMQADSLDASLELSDYKDMVELALAAISAGKKIVESDIHILVLANDLDKLNKKRAALISGLKDRDILATFSPAQAQTYFDSFIKLRPKKYPFLFDLRYPLAFRLNQGNQICDANSKFTASVIGHYCESFEAMGNTV